MENLIQGIAETQVFVPDDRLTRLIERYRPEEMTAEELDFVFAAQGQEQGRMQKKWKTQQ